MGSAAAVQHESSSSSSEAISLQTKERLQASISATSESRSKRSGVTSAVASMSVSSCRGTAVYERIGHLHGWVRPVASLCVPCRRSRLHGAYLAVYWRFAHLQRGPGHRISLLLRRKIERLLGEEPTRSDRQTAKRAGVSVDTVTRIRNELERQGALPATRSPRGPGPRQIVGPQHAGSLGVFIRGLRAMEADYVKWFGLRPAVRVSVTVSYASLVKFTARWNEDADTFVAADGEIRTHSRPFPILLWRRS